MIFSELNIKLTYHCQKQTPKYFPRIFGQYVVEYIEYLKTETNLKMSSIKIYEHSLSMFSQKMHHAGVDLETISLELTCPKIALLINTSIKKTVKL